MAPSIPTREPSEFTAGDTVKWTVSFGAFPADDGWTLSYRFRGPEVQDVTATADGAAHAVVISTIDSKKFQPGDYAWSAFASKGSERFLARAGRMTVLINLETVDETFDPRSHVEKVLEAIKAMIEGKATRDQSSYSIEGRSLSRLSWDELLTVKSHYETLLKQEINAERIQQGLQTNNIVRTRFRRPS